MKIEITHGAQTFVKHGSFSIPTMAKYRPLVARTEKRMPSWLRGTTVTKAHNVNDFMTTTKTTTTKPTSRKT